MSKIKNGKNCNSAKKTRDSSKQKLIKKISKRQTKTLATALFLHDIFSSSHLILAAAMFGRFFYCKMGHSSNTLAQNDKWY